MGLPDLTDDPADLAEAARTFLRERFLRVPAGFSGANFADRRDGHVCVVESEGNGRMCLTLPKLLITVVGIEKVIPRFQDLEVFLQLLPRSATGERMNPYKSIWTGVTAKDGPEEFHVVLLDNGRTSVLADEVTVQRSRCIRCGACLNAALSTGRPAGHAYGSMYPRPDRRHPHAAAAADASTRTSLPYASSLCGACYEVCPVKIDIPEILLHLRKRVVDLGLSPLGERLVMKGAAAVFASATTFAAAQVAGRLAQIPFVRRGLFRSLPGPLSGWTKTRDLRALPAQSFREWWKSR